MDSLCPLFIGTMLNNNGPLLTNGLKMLHVNKPWICMGCGIFTTLSFRKHINCGTQPPTHLGELTDPPGCTHPTTYLGENTHSPIWAHPTTHLGAPTHLDTPTHQITWAHPSTKLGAPTHPPGFTHPLNHLGTPIHRTGCTHTPTWVHPPTESPGHNHPPTESPGHTHSPTWAHPHTHLFFWIVSLIVSLQITFGESRSRQRWVDTDQFLNSKINQSNIQADGKSELSGSNFFFRDFSTKSPHVIWLD